MNYHSLSTSFISCCATLLFIGQGNTQTIADTADEKMYKYGEIIGRWTPREQLIVRVDTSLMIARDKRDRWPLYNEPSSFPYASLSGTLNGLTPEGWQLVTIYNTPTDNAPNEVRWVIRRRIERVNK